MVSLSWVYCSEKISKRQLHSNNAPHPQFSNNCYVFLNVVLCLVTQTLYDPMDGSPPGSPFFPGKNTGVSGHALLQGIFPTQGSNPGLLHCRWILYCLSYQGSPRILEQVAYPFSSGSSSPKNQTGVSCIAGGFFTSSATREALLFGHY